MNFTTAVRTKIVATITMTFMVLCITGCIVLTAMRGEPDTKLVTAIQLHGGKIVYYREIGNKNTQVKAISTPASALEKIDPMTFQVFPHLRVLHLTDIPAGAAGETYETACCVNGKDELTKLVAEYRKAGLLR